MNEPAASLRCELMLQDSTQHFLSELRKPHPDFSSLSSIFARLIQTMNDPPLEIAWFYSAATFRCSGFVGNDAPARVLAVKDLFQLLASCWSSFNGVKRVAALAPVISKMFELVKGGDFECVRAEIDCFVEAIVSYICICCCKGGAESCGQLEENLMGSFSDSVFIWTVDGGMETWNFEEYVKVFFPLIGCGVYQGVGAGPRIGYLAGIVMTEALLLRLCLKFACVGCGSRVDLQNDILKCAVNLINGFRNWHFFDIIFRTLLDPILPVTLLLGLEDEIVLRKALYHAVITIDYSFLSPQGALQMHTNDLKALAVSWLFIVDDAVQFIRKHSDQVSAISYIDAFSQCCLCSQLIEWVTSQSEIAQKTCKPAVSTPSSLIRWLLSLEAEGLRLFDHVTWLQSRAVAYKSRVIEDLSIVMPDTKSLEENLNTSSDGEGKAKAEFYVDQTRRGRLADDIFLAKSNLIGNGGRRKREHGEPIEGDELAKPKVLKCLSICDEGTQIRGSKVENFGFDETMEDMEVY